MISEKKRINSICNRKNFRWFIALIMILLNNSTFISSKDPQYDNDNFWSKLGNKDIKSINGIIISDIKDKQLTITLNNVPADIDNIELDNTKLYDEIVIDGTNFYPYKQPEAFAEPATHAAPEEPGVVKQSLLPEEPEKKEEIADDHSEEKKRVHKLLNKVFGLKIKKLVLSNIAVDQSTLWVFGPKRQLVTSMDYSPESGIPYVIDLQEKPSQEEIMELAPIKDVPFNAITSIIFQKEIDTLTATKRPADIEVYTGANMSVLEMVNVSSAVIEAFGRRVKITNTQLNVLIERCNLDYLGILGKSILMHVHTLRVKEAPKLLIKAEIVIKVMPALTNLSLECIEDIIWESNSSRVLYQKRLDYLSIPFDFLKASGISDLKLMLVIDVLVLTDVTKENLKSELNSPGFNLLALPTFSAANVCLALAKDSYLTSEIISDAIMWVSTICSGQQENMLIMANNQNPSSDIAKIFGIELQSTMIKLPQTITIRITCVTEAADKNIVDVKLLEVDSTQTIADSSILILTQTVYMDMLVKGFKDILSEYIINIPAIANLSKTTKVDDNFQVTCCYCNDVIITSDTIKKHNEPNAVQAVSKLDTDKPDEANNAIIILPNTKELCCKCFKNILQENAPNISTTPEEAPPQTVSEEQKNKNIVAKLVHSCMSFGTIDKVHPKQKATTASQAGGTPTAIAPSTTTALVYIPAFNTREIHKLFLEQSKLDFKWVIAKPKTSFFRKTVQWVLTF
ncbi:hypothetical protein NEOKW01_1804 [Nematocida sp. AWRm80]|nr:hypothetical protein NEOKW01_1804 [Nematocida sp. AWRm80]